MRNLASFRTIWALVSLCACGGGEAPTGQPAVPPGAATQAKTREPSVVAQERRGAAHRRNLFEVRARGRRDTRNLALDGEAVGWPEASSTAAGSEPLLAVDGDPTTAWRGAAGGPWRWELPFRRVVHLSLLRFLLGDDADQAIASAFRVDYRPAAGGSCPEGAPWLPLGARDDRDDNTFTHGPRDVHAQRQALFADVDACALRVVIDAVEGDQGPSLRELQIYEGAPSLARAAEASASDAWASGPLVKGASPRGANDGSYEKFWAGEPGKKAWSLTLRLPEPRHVDRISLVLGHDGVTKPLGDAPGRRYAGSYLPLEYSVSTSHDDDPAHLIPAPEAASPRHQGAPVPVRKRLVRLSSPRPVKLLRLSISRATGPWGEDDERLAAPVVREVGLYGADDPRPAVLEPTFFSVDANPSGLTADLSEGSSYAGGLFARAAYHRLRRVLLGFDADTRWPADALRPRDAGTGRFLEVIEGDDPLLSEAFIKAFAQPPALLLSGSFDWEFDDHTGRWPARHRHWRWDVDAPATSEDRGMGQLRPVVQRRAAPLVGFCGGAQILALLEAQPSATPEADRDDLSALDAVLQRNDNQPIRGVITREEPYERAWWYDKPERDVARPTILFSPRDPLFDAPLSAARSASREFPSSHGDMIRASAFDGPLRRFLLVGWSEFCRPWVDPSGLEPTWADPANPSRRCVRVPQAFRSRDPGYPVVGFQFHPEQRDFQRLAPGSPHSARGDNINLIANTVDLILDSYLRLAWPEH